MWVDVFGVEIENVVCYGVGGCCDEWNYKCWGEFVGVGYFGFGDDDEDFYCGEECYGCVDLLYDEGCLLVLVCCIGIECGYVLFIDDCECMVILIGVVDD